MLEDIIYILVVRNQMYAIKIGIGEMDMHDLNSNETLIEK